jgi:hypothetical protein
MVKTAQYIKELNIRAGRAHINYEGTGTEAKEE